MLNFGALAIGGLFTGPGVTSEWYQSLDKAPWTPPGWVFGAAWTTIMVCFTIYLAKIWPLADNKRKLAVLFGVQWVLNVSWNPAFFYFHKPMLGFLIITTLTAAVALFMVSYNRKVKAFTWLLVPYFVWLVIATSLNAYIILMNK